MSQSSAFKGQSREEPETVRKLEQSLERFALLLAGIRYLFLFSGLAFAIWEGFEVALLQGDFSARDLAGVIFVSVVVPGLVWISAYWGEKQAREVIRARRELAASIRLAQHEAEQRSEVEIARQREDAALAEIGRIMSSSLEINEVYERFAELARKLIPGDRVSINIVNPEDGTFHNAHVSGIDVPERRQGRFTPLEGSVTHEVLTTKSSVLVHPESLEYLESRYPGLVPEFRTGMRSMLSSPLISDDKVIGVLHFRSLQPRAYAQRYVKIAESISAQIAGAIANAQKHAALQAALAKIKTLRGLMPICASCKKIRDDKGYWNQIEEYIRDHSDAEFSHGICPECAVKLYPWIQSKVSAPKEASQ